MQSLIFFFFFQAEDGIRDLTVTRVQTCALPIFPGECPDAVAGSDPQPQQRASEPLGSALGLAVGIAVDRAFDSARDDFRVAMIASRMFDDRRDQERPLRHQSPHRLLPYAILTVIAGQFDTDARSLFRRGRTCK